MRRGSAEPRAGRVIMGRNEIGVHGALVALTAGRRTHFCRPVVLQRTASALCPR